MGDISRIFAINANSGDIVATLTIRGAVHHDWEDLSVGPCGMDMKGSCIYIADIGSSRPYHTIYKVQEPKDLVDSTLDFVSALTFRWQEADGESVMVDPQGEVYVISKASNGNGLFAKLPSSGWRATTPVTIPAGNTVRLGLHTTHHDPLGADLFPDGSALLVKCREDIYYYAFGPKPDYVQQLPTINPQVVNTYVRSDVGQAVAWKEDASGFYLLPEGRIPTIDFYAVQDSSEAVVS